MAIFKDDDHFTINNIPFGVVSSQMKRDRKRIATRFMGEVFIIEQLIQDGHLGEVNAATQKTLQQPTLNDFAALSKDIHQSVRKSLQHFFTDSTQHVLSQYGLPVAQVTMHLPVKIGDFTDFSCSQHHVMNASEAMTGTRSMPPGFLHFPVGYSGRCSSVVPSGRVIRRPLGQFRDGDGGVVFGPSRKLDFELEVGVVVGRPSSMGEPVSLSAAEDHIFGLVLLNDWSARDIQALEMNPLGPLNGKSFGTSMSPWIITMEALEPFSCRPPARDTSVTAVDYLKGVENCKHYAIDLQVDLLLPQTAFQQNTDDQISKAETLPQPWNICRSRFDSLYWPVGSLVAHQTVNGCPISSGDILGTGTISGATVGSHGCLLEATKGGKEGIVLGDDVTRTYLVDGDGIRLTAWAGKLGTNDCVGFGECIGWITPAITHA